MDLYITKGLTDNSIENKKKTFEEILKEQFNIEKANYKLENLNENKFNLNNNNSINNLNKNSEKILYSNYRNSIKNKTQFEVENLSITDSIYISDMKILSNEEFKLENKNEISHFENYDKENNDNEKYEYINNYYDRIPLNINNFSNNHLTNNNFFNEEEYNNIIINLKKNTDLNNNKNQSVNNFIDYRFAQYNLESNNNKVNELEEKSDSNKSSKIIKNRILNNSYSKIEEPEIPNYKTPINFLNKCDEENYNTDKNTNFKEKIEFNKNNHNPDKYSNIIEKEESNKTNKLKIEFETKLKGFLKTEIIELMNSEKWEDRKTGFVKLNEFLNNSKNNNLQNLKNNFDCILSFIKISIKNFKENNFNILREAFHCYEDLTKILSQEKIFNKKTCESILKEIWEKLSDSKLKESLTNLIFTFMEYFSPNFIITNLIKYLEKTKSINLLKEYSMLFEKSIEEFGINNIPVKDIVSFGKILSNNSNPQLRYASTSLLCSLYKFIGNDLKIFLNKDIKESTYKAIESELDKITILTGNDLIHQSKGKRLVKDIELNTQQQIDCFIVNNKKSDNNNFKLIVAQDISKKISSKIIKDINEGKWVDKKESFEAIDKILEESNMRILPIGIIDFLINTLKTKFSDGNKQLVRLAIQCFTKIIEALGHYFKSIQGSICKNLAHNLLSNLSDKMLLVREDVLNCLEKWIEFGGVDSIVIHIQDQLNKNENFEVRNDLLNFLLKHLNLISDSPYNLNIFKDFVPGIVKCLMDKVNIIRSMSEEFLEYSLGYITLDLYYENIKDLKPAIKETLKLIFDKYSNKSDEYENENKRHNNINTKKNNKINVINELTNYNSDLKKSCEKIDKTNKMNIRNNKAIENKIHDQSSQNISCNAIENFIYNVTDSNLSNYELNKNSDFASPILTPLAFQKKYNFIKDKSDPSQVPVNNLKNKIKYSKNQVDLERGNITEYNDGNLNTIDFCKISSKFEENNESRKFNKVNIGKNSIYKQKLGKKGSKKKVRSQSRTEALNRISISKNNREKSRENSLSIQNILKRKTFYNTNIYCNENICNSIQTLNNSRNTIIDNTIENNQNSNKIIVNDINSSIDSNSKKLFSKPQNFLEKTNLNISNGKLNAISKCIVTKNFNYNLKDDDKNKNKNKNINDPKKNATSFNDSFNNFNLSKNSGKVYKNYDNHNSFGNSSDDVTVSSKSNSKVKSKVKNLNIKSNHILDNNKDFSKVNQINTQQDFLKESGISKNMRQSCKNTNKNLINIEKLQKQKNSEIYNYTNKYEKSSYISLTNQQESINSNTVKKSKNKINKINFNSLEYNQKDINNNFRNSISFSDMNNYKNLDKSQNNNTISVSTKFSYTKNKIQENEYSSQDKIVNGNSIEFFQTESEIFNLNFKLKISKEKRNELDKREKGFIDTNPTEENILKLKENLRQIFREEVYFNLINEDQNINLNLIIYIMNKINNSLNKTNSSANFENISLHKNNEFLKLFENLDIVLKWISWRFSNCQNPIFVKGVLEFFAFISKNLKENVHEIDGFGIENKSKYKEDNYDYNFQQLNETEACIILYYLLNNQCVANSKTKSFVKNLIYNYCGSLISISKTYAIITNYLLSYNKNLKVCCETLDVLFKISQDFGFLDFSNKDIKMLIKLSMLNNSDSILKSKTHSFLISLAIENTQNFLAVVSEFDINTKKILLEKFDIPQNSKKQQTILCAEFRLENLKNSNYKNFLNVINTKKKDFKKDHKNSFTQVITSDNEKELKNSNSKGFLGRLSVNSKTNLKQKINNKSNMLNKTSINYSENEINFDNPSFNKNNDSIFISNVSNVNLKSNFFKNSKNKINEKKKINKNNIDVKKKNLENPEQIKQTKNITDNKSFDFNNMPFNKSIQTIQKEKQNPFQTIKNSNLENKYFDINLNNSINYANEVLNTNFDDKPKDKTKFFMQGSFTFKQETNKKNDFDSSIQNLSNFVQNKTNKISNQKITYSEVSSEFCHSTPQKNLSTNSTIKVPTNKVKNNLFNSSELIISNLKAISSKLNTSGNVEFSLGKNGLKKDEINNDISNNLKETKSTSLYKLFDEEDSFNIFSILEKINLDFYNESLESLVHLLDLMANKYETSKLSLISNLDNLLIKFINLLKKIFDEINLNKINNLNIEKINITKYLLTTIYRITSEKELINYALQYNISELYEVLLQGMLIENSEQATNYQQGLIIGYSINSIILKLLENFDYTKNFEILFDFILKYRKIEAKAKIVSLVVKCLLKLVQIMNKIIQEIKIEKIFYKIHFLITQIDNDFPDLVTGNNLDLIIIKFLKNITHEISKIKKDSIVNDYTKFIENFDLNDKYIKTWIKEYLNNDTIEKENKINLLNSGKNIENQNYNIKLENSNTKINSFNDLDKNNLVSFNNNSTSNTGKEHLNNSINNLRIENCLNNNNFNNNSHVEKNSYYSNNNYNILKTQNISNSGCSNFNQNLLLFNKSENNKNNYNCHYQNISSTSYLNNDANHNTNNYYYNNHPEISPNSYFIQDKYDKKNFNNNNILQDKRVNFEDISNNQINQIEPLYRVKSFF